MKYHFRIHKEKRGYSAQCVELKGCITQGDSLKKLYKNMKEALELYIQEPTDSDDVVLLPDDSIRKSKNIVEVALDPEIAFPFLMRYYRIKHKMTQQQAAKLLGFEGLYSYQRLESQRCNPTLKILSLIKKAFPEFSIDYALSY